MSDFQTQTYRITGMDCADCAKTIEKGVARLSGVNNCAINFGAAKLRVVGTTPRDAVVARVRELGYDVRDEADALAPTARKQGLLSFISAFADRLPASGVLGFLRFLLQRTDTTLAVLGAILILPSLILVEIVPLFTGFKPESHILDAMSFGGDARGWLAHCAERLALSQHQS